jgi:virulence-associated protein
MTYVNPNPPFGSPNAPFIANSVAGMLQGKLEQPKINSIVTALETPTSSVYPANATFISLLFYFRVVCNVNGGKSFGGNAGGIGLPTGGTSLGNVFTNDIERLYQRTDGFSFESAAGYLGIQFFDAQHNLLGHYDGGSIGVLAVGGGQGGW